MGILGRFERRVEGAVSSVFARAFKGDVQPVEIAARLQRELDIEAKLLSRDKRLVPNVFSVQLSAHDHEKLTPYRGTLIPELITELQQHAANLGYVFNGPITINLERDDSLPVGRFRVSSEAVAGVRANQSPAYAPEPGSAPLVIEVNGTRHPLTPPGLIIGRGAEADLRINDPGVSRTHAEIRVSGVGPGQAIEIVDLGSMNGILVNGRRVRQATLGDGSRIEIGSTRMLVHSPTER